MHAMKSHFLLRWIASSSFLILATLGAHPANFTPTVTTDLPISSTAVVNSSGQITNQGNAITLRSAVIAANAAGGTNSITLGAGTYQLTIPGTGETASSGDSTIGDLDILAPASGRNTLTVQGTGAASTTIQQTSGIDRIFDAHPVNLAGSVTFNLSDVTLKAGNLIASSGGAILAGRAGDVTSVSNSVFDGNSAPNSGAISQSSSLVAHDLIITNCRFTNNTATSGGPGAVNYNGVGTVNITGCTFSGNTAATQGGAINITGGGTGPVTVNILRNAFLNNTANGTQFGGAAVAVVNAQTININFNRLIGNTSPSLNTTLTPNFGDGRVITAAGGTIATFNVDNNWWGVNTGPVTTANSRSLFGASTTQWLLLRNSASPTTVNVGGATTVGANIFGLNTGGATSSGNLIGLPAFPASGTVFGNAQRGTIPGGTIQFVNGAATVVFTGTTAGAGGVDAVADSQTITAPINVNGPPTVSNVSKGANEDVAIAFAAADFTPGSYIDPEGAALTSVRVTSLPANGVLRISGNTFAVPQDIAIGSIGNLTYTSNANYNGADSFGWNGSDGVLFALANATVNLTVNAVNDKPTFTAANPPAVSEDAGAQTLVGWATFNAGAANESGQAVLAYAVSSVSNAALFSAGPSIATNGTLTYTPAANANGTSTFQVRVQDNSGAALGGIDTSDPQTFTITVNAVNDAPQIAGQNAVTTPEESARAIALADLIVTDVDNAGYPAGFTLTVANGTNYTRSGNTITPVLNFNGTLTVPVTVTDPAAGVSASFNLSVSVTPVNDAPVITGQTAISTAFNTARSIALSDLTVTDVDNTYPSGFTLSVQNGTNYSRVGNTITPAPNFFGTLSVPAQVNDGAANSNVFNLAVTVNPDPLAAQNGTSIAPEPGGGYRISFLGNPGQTYTIQFTSALVPSPISWQSLGTRTADANGRYSIVDIPPPGTLVRFYRSIFP